MTRAARLSGTKRGQTKHIVRVNSGFVVLMLLHQIDLSLEKIAEIIPMDKRRFNASGDDDPLYGALLP